MSDNSTASIDAQLFRDVLGHYPTGVVVVTGIDTEGDILALVVGTFNSVSLDPPLVSFMPMKTSRTFERMRACTSLCINVVGGEQEDVVLTIAQRWENKLDGIDWRPSPSGDPILADSVAWIDTEIHETVEAGDHWIVLCAVRDMAITNAVSPLVFFQGGYGSFVCTSLLARMDHEILPAIHAAHAARGEVEALATDIGCEVTVFTTVGPEEMATVLSVMAPGMDREADFGRRVPMIPPIGDTYFVDKSPEEQARWMGQLRDVDDSVRNMHAERLAFLERHGFLYSLLPPGVGRSAYDSVRDATRDYSRGRLTPMEQRDIRRRLTETSVDYHVSDLEDSRTYDIGSLVIPVRDRHGVCSMTLRLSQLPAGADGAQVLGWIERAGSAVAALSS